MPRTHYTKREKDIKREKSRKQLEGWNRLSSVEKTREIFKVASFLASPLGVLKSKAATGAYKYLTSRAPATGSSSTGTTKKKGGLDREEDEKPSAVASKKGGTIRKKKYVTQSKRYSNGGKVYPK